jgi:hypothetical protein
MKAQKQAPKAKDQAPSAAAEKEPVYALNEAAMALAAQGTEANNTLQRKEKGMGKEWRKTGIQSTNTRALSCAVIHAAYPEGKFTKAQAMAALNAADPKVNGLHGHATAASRTAAFIKNGYFAPGK